MPLNAWMGMVTRTESVGGGSAAGVVCSWCADEQRIPSSIGHSLQVLVTDLPAPEPLYQSIEIESLHLVRDAELGLRAVLSVAESKPWPRIHVRVHEGLQQRPLGVVSLWLRKTQNLGRISGGPAGWSPTVVMTSRIPREGLTNKQILERAFADQGSAIPWQVGTWLHQSLIVEKDEIETALLGHVEMPEGRGFALHEADIPFDKLQIFAENELLKHPDEPHSAAQPAATIGPVAPVQI